MPLSALGICSCLLPSPACAAVCAATFAEADHPAAAPSRITSCCCAKQQSAHGAASLGLLLGSSRHRRPLAGGGRGPLAAARLGTLAAAAGTRLGGRPAAAPQGRQRGHHALVARGWGGKGRVGGRHASSQQERNSSYTRPAHPKLGGLQLLPPAQRLQAKYQSHPHPILSTTAKAPTSCLAKSRSSEARATSRLGFTSCGSGSGLGGRG